MLVFLILQPKYHIFLIVTVLDKQHCPDGNGVSCDFYKNVHDPSSIHIINCPEITTSHFGDGDLQYFIFLGHSLQHLEKVKS